MNTTQEALKQALPDRRTVTAAGDPEDYINSGWNDCLDAIREALAEQPAQPDIDWHDMYLKEKRHSEMWLAKYEQVAGPAERAGPVGEQPAQQECNHCGGTGDVSGEYPGVACPECSGSGVQAQPEFIKHEVENAYDWSEWVCPDPESYLMKCCDCGLVHEAQFRVAKYKPAPSDECQVVSDPDLQAQFRMRRSEQWSPKDTAHRAGGLPMAEQPAQQQETVACPNGESCRHGAWCTESYCQEHCEFRAPPASKPWVGLTDEQIGMAFRKAFPVGGVVFTNGAIDFARAIEAKLREKNA